MATVSWAISASGDWATAADWSGGVPPGMADSVTLPGAGGAVVTHSVGADTITQLTAAGALAITGGTLAVTGGAAFDAALSLSGGALALSGATNTASGAVSLDGGADLRLAAHARLTIAGALTVGQATVISSAATIEGAGTFLTQGATSLADNYRILTIGGGAQWVNTGTVTDGMAITVGTTLGATASIVNSATGVFDLITDAIGISSAEVLANGTYALGGSTFANAGVLEKTGGTGTSSIQSYLSNTGQIVVSSGELDLLGGGGLGGTLSGGGTLSMVAGSFALNGLQVTTGTALTLAGGRLALALKQAVSMVGLSSGTIDGRGTLTTAGTTTLAPGGVNQSILTVGGGARLANSGTLFLSSGVITMGDASGESGSLANATGGVIDLTGDSSIADNGSFVGSNYVLATSTFTNAGLLEKTGGTGTSDIGSFLSSSGTIAVSSGVMALVGGGALSGAVTGTTLELTAGRFTLKSLAVTAGTSLVLDGGALGIAAGATVAGLSFTEGTIDGPGTLANALSVTLGASVETNGASLILGGGVTFNNTGTLALSTGGIATGDQAGLTASLINAASGVFDFTDDGSIIDGSYYDTSYHFGGSSLANAGVLEKTGGTGTSSIASVLTNTGTINVATGAIDLIGGGTLGGTVTGGGTLLLGGGLFTLNAATVVPGTTVVLAGGTIAVAFGTVLSNLPIASGEIDGPGTLANTLVTTLAAGPAGATVLTLGGGLTFDNTGTLDLSSGGIAGGDVAGSTATLINEAGAVIDFTGDAGISNGFDFGGGATYGNVTLTNLGLLEKTGGTGGSDIVATIADDTGAITVTSGALDLLGGGTVGGTLSGGGTVLLGAGAFVVDGPTLLGGTALLLAGGTVAIANGAVLSNLAVTSGEIDGPGGFASAGITQAGTVVLGGAATWTNTGTATVASLILGGLAGGDVTLSNAANAVFVVGAISGAAGSAVRNAGSLEVTGIGLATALGAALDTTGVLTIDAGALQLAGGGVLSGRLSGPGQLWLLAGTFTLDGLAADQQGQIVVNGGTATLLAANASLAGGFSDQSGAVVLGRGTHLNLSGSVTFGSDFLASGHVDGPGTLATSASVYVADTDYTDGTGLLLGGGVVWRNTGVVEDAGFIRVGDGRGLNVAFSNAATGVFEITTDDGGIGNNAVLSPAGAWTVGRSAFGNSGLLIKSGGDGRSFIASTVTNNGSIDAANGTLDFLVKIIGTGTMTIEAGATLETNGFASTQTVVFDGPFGTLMMDAKQSVTTPIAGFGVTDAIDLSFAASATASITGNTLSITPGGGTALTFLSAASLSGTAVSVTPDGNGGTLVSLIAAPASSPASASAVMAGTAAGLSGLDFPDFAAGRALDVTDLRLSRLDLGFGAGLLTASDGTHHAMIGLPGVAALADIRAAADGQGGTLLSYHPA
jgi:hypothetical protein